MPLADKLTAVGIVIVICLESVQPNESVTSIVYIPETLTLKGEVLITLFTLNIFEPLPPVTLNVIVPFCPEQFGFVPFAVKSIFSLTVNWPSE